MTIEDQIKILCIRSHVTVAEVARRIGQSPQNLNGKLKRRTLRIEEIEQIAEVLNCKFERAFILPNGERV